MLFRSGIHGRVASLEDDIVGLEVAPGVVIRIVRGAISARPGAEPAASEAQVVEGAADGGAEA